MRPVLLPLIERLGHRQLGRRGFVPRPVTTPHGTLNVYDARGPGALPTAIVLHGIGSAGTAFLPVLARLQPHMRRIVVPDYPGHGFSENATTRLTPEVLFESIFAALDSEVPEPAIVIGNSLGGAVALRYAVQRPERVRGLVLLSPAGAPSSDAEWAELQRTFDMKTRAQARAFMGRLYHRSPWFAPVLAHEFPAAFGRRAVRELFASATQENAASVEEVGSLAMPVLFVWGKSERILPQSHFDFYARSLPSHAVIERPEGVGHCAHLDAPRELAERIVRFARGLA